MSNTSSTGKDSLSGLQNIAESAHGREWVCLGLSVCTPLRVGGSRAECMHMVEGGWV